jgi:hypothetical protein
MAEGVRAPEGTVLTLDGVSMLHRGDTCLMLYQKAARLHRTRWLFDVLDAALEGPSRDILGLLIVLPSADPPDVATHRENYERLGKIDPLVRRLVTVPIGNALKTGIVRAVMRGLNVVTGRSKRHFIADSVEDGIAQLLEAKGPQTPSTEQILTDVRALYLSLGEPDPHFEVRLRVRDR